jgi:hypothetical protein
MHPVSQLDSGIRSKHINSIRTVIRAFCGDRQTILAVGAGGFK